MKNLRKKFKWSAMLLLGVSLTFFSPQKSACTTTANASSGVFCCDFCYQDYDACIAGGGDEGGCAAQLCACMTGCGICPLCP